MVWFNWSMSACKIFDQNGGFGEVRDVDLNIMWTEKDTFHLQNCISCVLCDILYFKI